MSNRVLIPRDEEAEWMVVALAIAHPANARAASAELEPDEFYRPILAAALESAVQLDAVRDVTRRISAVSMATGLRVDELTARVDDRIGPLPRWTTKVRSAARRRRAMALAARVYNDAAAAPLAEVTAAARELLAELESAQSEAQAAEEPSEPSAGERHALGHYRRQSNVPDS